MKFNKDLPPKTGGVPWYKKVKLVLQVVSGAILAAPVKLPEKLKAGAKYMALLLGIVDSLEQGKNKEEEESG